MPVRCLPANDFNCTSAPAIAFPVWSRTTPLNDVVSCPRQTEKSANNMAQIAVARLDARHKFLIPLIRIVLLVFIVSFSCPTQCELKGTVMPDILTRGSKQSTLNTIG